MSKPAYIIAGGGTGGHLYPGLAVADRLSRNDPDAVIAFACSNRPIDREILSATSYIAIEQPTRPLRKNPIRVPGFLMAWRRSIKLARKVLDDLQPKSVLGLGGFAAGAMVKEAAKRSIPTAILNPDIVPGKANQYLAKRVDAIFTQFESTQSEFAPDVAHKIKKVGCPTRPGLLEGSREEACEHFGLDPNRKTLFVFGGSILAESVTDTLCMRAEDMDKYSDKWQVLAVVGNKKLDFARQVFNSRVISTTILEYCHRMDLAYAVADLAITRGGAGTVAELSATATPSIVMPYPYHADRQQYRNIEDLLRDGCAKMVEDRGVATINSDLLRKELIPLISDNEAFEEMRSAAKNKSLSGASDAVADWMSGKTNQNDDDI